MPFTLAHPVAVLPGKPLCPRWLDFPALVVGSMAPDLPYFFVRQNLGHYAHTARGSLTLSLPMGVFLLCAFYLVRRPLCYLLPMPHRGVLLPLAETRFDFQPLKGLIILVSLLIGIWTHLFFDGFTHEGGFFVERYSLLKHVLFQTQNLHFRVYSALQYSGSVFGLAVLAFFYWRWFSQQTIPQTTEHDRWRYLLVGAVAVVSSVLGVPLAAYFASKFNGYGAIKIFIVRELVIAMSLFFFIITGLAFLIDLRRRHKL